MGNVIDTVDLTWENVEFCIGNIAQQIHKSGFVPHYLVGITLGGLIPLALLAEELDIRKVITFSAQSYDGTKRGVLSITYKPIIDLRGKKVLLVDEIANSGSTLAAIANILVDEYLVAELKTAVISYNREHCRRLPDFYCLEETRWVVFPWEESPNKKY